MPRAGSSRASRCRPRRCCSRSRRTASRSRRPVSKPETGRLIGKGPFRAVVPQFVASPPDLSLTADPSCPPKVAAEHRFHEEYDHNAGASQNAVVAIRVKPLPKGTRDIDWQTTALKRLAAEEVVFFGAIR